jgi:hypothetical protein
VCLIPSRGSLVLVVLGQSTPKIDLWCRSTSTDTKNVHFPYHTKGIVSDTENILCVTQYRQAWSTHSTHRHDDICNIGGFSKCSDAQAIAENFEQWRLSGARSTKRRQRDWMWHNDCDATWHYNCSKPCGGNGSLPTGRDLQYYNCPRHPLVDTTLNEWGNWNMLEELISLCDDAEF